MGLKNNEFTPCFSFTLISVRLCADPRIKKSFLRFLDPVIFLLNDGI